MAFEDDPEGYRMAVSYAGRDFDKPKEVTITPLSVYGGEEWSLDEFYAVITEAISTIPVDKQASAKVELEGDEYSKLTISYRGIESSDVVADRIRQCEQYVAKQREAERRTYKRLKEKFG